MSQNGATRCIRKSVIGNVHIYAKMHPASGGGGREDDELGGLSTPPVLRRPVHRSRSAGRRRKLRNLAGGAGHKDNELGRLNRTGRDVAAQVPERSGRRPTLRQRTGAAEQDGPRRSSAGTGTQREEADVKTTNWGG